MAPELHTCKNLAMKAHFTSASRSLVQLVVVASLGLGLGLGVHRPAHAVDGCKLLLCLAGNWQNIAQCVPTVRQALRDLVLGHAWPFCSMGGGMGGSTASANQFVMPEQCPPQYRTGWTAESGQTVYDCPFAGVIHVAVDGQPWSRTWWSMSGEVVVEWLPAARAALANRPGAMDERFDRDRAAWMQAGGLAAFGDSAAPTLAPDSAADPATQGGSE